MRCCKICAKLRFWGKDTLTYPYCNLFPGYRCKYGKLCSLYVKRKVIYYRVTNSIDDGKKWKAQIFGLVVSTFHARVESFHLKPVISFYIYKSYSIFFIPSGMYCSLYWYFWVISIYDYVNIHKPLSPDIVPALTKSTSSGNWVLDTQTLIDETFLFFVSSSW